MTSRWIGFALVVVALIIDQSAKAFALTHLNDSAPVYVLPFLNFVLSFNSGVSFGLFANSASWWVLSGTGIIVSIALAVWMFRSEHQLEAISLGLIIGGALGNVGDRFRHGAVVDFIDIHAVGYHWPTFNFADVFIVCGCVLLIITTFVRSSTPQHHSSSQE